MKAALISAKKKLLTSRKSSAEGVYSLCRDGVMSALANSAVTEAEGGDKMPRVRRSG